MAVPSPAFQPDWPRWILSSLIGAIRLVLAPSLRAAAPEEAEDTPDANRARPETLLAHVGSDWNSPTQILEAYYDAKLPVQFVNLAFNHLPVP